MTTFRTIEISNPDYGEPGVTHVTVKSAALKRRADLSLYVPTGIHAQPLPLVILLHGVFGSHWAWLYKGGAHRVMDRLIEEEGLPPMVLAMPSDGLWGDGSGYLRHADADYRRWIAEEVPAGAEMAVAGVSSTPRFIAGLSMGGYGALRIGALHAADFKGISAHSSITDVSNMWGFVEEPETAFDLTDDAPPQVLACMKAHAHQLPPLRFDCGTEDELIEANRELNHQLKLANIPHAYAEFPGGHTWEYWHEHLADSLRFFAQQLV